MTDDAAADAPDEATHNEPDDPFAPYCFAPIFHARLRQALEELYHQGRLTSWPPSAETVDGLARQLRSRSDPNMVKKAAPVFGIPDNTGNSREMPPVSDQPTEGSHGR